VHAGRLRLRSLARPREGCAVHARAGDEDGARAGHHDPDLLALIFLLRQFFLTLPRDLDDAARIDGCSTWGILYRILLPLSKPALAAVAIFAFIRNWNSFLYPLIYLNDMEKYTLQLGLNMYRGQYYTEFHLMMAVALLVLVPVIVVFFVAQKYFIQGIALTGLKG
jgi:multiple sugar transport system permease protein